jgi:3-methyladenine DNA glycosylase AlkD
MAPEAIKSLLMTWAEPQFRAFSMSLMPGVSHVLGVRLPKLRKLARELARGDVDRYLQEASDATFEEIMLQGMVIGYAANDLPKTLARIQKFVPKMDNWSVCDSFCGTLKFVEKNRSFFLRFLSPYFKSKEEYDVRFAIVIGLNYYRVPEYIDVLLQKLRRVKHKGYYAQMALAWALSMAYIKFPQETEKILISENAFDDFVFNKTIQKICESRQVDTQEKMRLRGLTRK